ncbi:hypothetical protein [Streptomyces sp. CC53]|uniref:hypothetical protein n=1 Tax=Streptomyces sp. CC53 TaxID=1906740 RepID=UPI00115FA25F|nr:hypothetical protein [Streptomyces sp. CC53]
MIDRWHDAYHEDHPDYENCPYCQDDLLLAEPEFPPPELLYNGEPVDLGSEVVDGIYEARFVGTDRAFIVTAEEIILDARDWE